jgi:hypothetical protein
MQSSKMKEIIKNLPGVKYLLRARNYYATKNSPKFKTIKYFSEKYKSEAFVETGTYLGDMTNAVKFMFKEVYSIELDHNLFQKAVDRFSNFKNVHILEGDSGVILKSLVGNLPSATMFWLDAHYSEGATAMGTTETPIEQELSTIFSSHLKNFVILIDDARLFVGEKGYPTLQALRDMILNKAPNCQVQVEMDIIRIFSK